MLANRLFRPDIVYEKIWAAHDCGKALSPVPEEGQIEGSVYMGAAEALMEHHEVKHDHAGLLDAPSLLDYRIPTALDTPEIESMIVESNEPMGPYGAKEAGEGPLPTPSTTPSACASIPCRLRPRRCWPC